MSLWGLIGAPSFYVLKHGVDFCYDLRNCGRGQSLFNCSALSPPPPIAFSIAAHFGNARPMRARYVSVTLLLGLLSATIECFLLRIIQDLRWGPAVSQIFLFPYPNFVFNAAHSDLFPVDGRSVCKFSEFRQARGFFRSALRVRAVFVKMFTPSRFELGEPAALAPAHACPPYPNFHGASLPSSQKLLGNYCKNLQ
jgi:hypothetical protein